MAPNLATTLLALLMTAAALAGCSADVSPDTGDQVADASAAQHEPAQDSSPTPPTTSSSAPPSSAAAPTATLPPAQPRLGPVVFAGHLVAPDAGVFDSGYCGAYPSPAVSDDLENVTWQSFALDRPLYGWTFAFDVDGIIADFSGGRSGTMPPSSGPVPPGSTYVRVCSPSETDVDYQLTLTPPGPVVFAGHVYAPDPARQGEGFGHCHGYYHAAGYDHAVAPLTTDSFALAGNYDNWSFAFNVDGLAADFHAPDTPTDNGELASSGTVPPGAYEVFVCSQSGVDTDFQLMLTPPV